MGFFPTFRRWTQIQEVHPSSPVDSQPLFLTQETQTGCAESPRAGEKISFLKQKGGTQAQLQSLAKGYSV